MFVKTDLVVLNFGGPRTDEEVEPFLFELFNDPDLIHLPMGPRFQERFAKIISSRRSKTLKEHYAHIGGSPLVPTTDAQVEALREALGPDAPTIHVGMRYTAPTIDHLVASVAKAPPERIVAIALFPHYSDTTTGSSFNAFSAAMARAGLGGIPVRYVPAFYDHPAYIEAMVDLIGRAAADAPDDAHILFSAHGLPSTYYKTDADPYPNQIHDSVRLIMRALPQPRPYSLAFQSRVGPTRWLAPSVETELGRLADRDTHHVVVVPLSFVTEGIETLYEIDEEIRAFATGRGVTLHRVPAVDTHPRFIAALAEVVRAALADDSEGGLGQHTCVRCLLPRPHQHRTRVRCLDCNHRTPEYLLRLPPRP